jgi:quinol monooxygenase YgiN
MYSVKIRNLPDTDDADEFFEKARKNCKSIIGAKVCHDYVLIDINTHEVAFMLEIYFSNQQEAIMFELKCL